MKIGRIEALEQQHARLERELSEMAAWPSTDPSRMRALKQHKLQIKDNLVAAWSAHRQDYQTVSAR